MSFRSPRRHARPGTTRAAVVLGAAALLAAVLGAPTVAAQSYTTWQLAEGATGRSANFLEDILVANPSATDTLVRITFLTGSGPSPTHVEFTLKASSRASVRVNSLPGLSDAEISAVVESLDGVDIVVERSMYWPAATRRGGHNSPGVTTAATKWFLAEGSTGYFGAFVLVANPDPTRTARVKVTFLLPGGGTVPYRPDPSTPAVDTIDLPPQTRYNVWVNAEVPELSGGKAFSTVVESMNSVGIIAERAMYWNNENVWEGGHNSVGVTAASPVWLLAEGTTKSVPGLTFETFLLLANPNDTATRARVLFFTAAGTSPLQRTYDLAPYSRENVWVNTIAPLANKDFSIKVESVAAATADPPQPIVVERAVYWGPGTGPPVPNWIEGHNTPGVTAEATKWVFAEGMEDGFADAPGLNFDTYFLVANSHPVNLDLRATFVREDGTGIVRTFTVPAESRATFAGFQFPELTNQKFAAFFEAMNDVPFVAERAMYWGAGYFGGHASTGVPWTGAIATPPAPPPPRATGISPSAGPAAGGTRVTIAGSNFRSAATSVVIGGIPASAVTVVNASMITAIAGALPTTEDLTVDVVVTNDGVATTLANAFTWVAPKQPEVESISPATGPAIGGTTVTITGRNFNPASLSVTFGGATAPIITATPTTITVNSPPTTIPSDSTSRAVEVVVTGAGLNTTAPVPFTYTTFTLTDITLAFGDSITWGTTDCIYDPILGRVCKDSDGGYPIRLKQFMQDRYPTQASAINVINQGKPGEWSANGRNRLPSVLEPSQDLVVLLEGINGLEDQGASEVAEDMRAMVQTAKSAGKRVILCTLTPVSADPWNPPQSMVSDASARIRQVAADEGVVLADMFQVLSGGAYLSGDGLHPTNFGYRRMAEFLFNLIRQNFEQAPPAAPPPSQ